MAQIAEPDGQESFQVSLIHPIHEHEEEQHLVNGDDSVDTIRTIATSTATVQAENFSQHIENDSLTQYLQFDPKSQSPAPSPYPRVDAHAGQGQGQGQGQGPAIASAGAGTGTGDVAHHGQSSTSADGTKPNALSGSDNIADSSLFADESFNFTASPTKIGNLNSPSQSPPDSNHHGSAGADASHERYLPNPSPQSRERSTFNDDDLFGDTSGEQSTSLTFNTSTSFSHQHAHDSYSDLRNHHVDEHADADSNANADAVIAKATPNPLVNDETISDEFEWSPAAAQKTAQSIDYMQRPAVPLVSVSFDDSRETQRADRTATVNEQASDEDEFMVHDASLEHEETGASEIAANDSFSVFESDDVEQNQQRDNAADVDGKPKDESFSVFELDEFEMDNFEQSRTAQNDTNISTNATGHVSLDTAPSQQYAAASSEPNPFDADSRMSSEYRADFEDAADDSSSSSIDFGPNLPRSNNTSMHGTSQSNFLVGENDADDNKDAESQGTNPFSDSRIDLLAESDDGNDEQDVGKEQSVIESRFAGSPDESSWMEEQEDDDDGDLSVIFQSHCDGDDGARPEVQDEFVCLGDAAAILDADEAKFHEDSMVAESGGIELDAGSQTTWVKEAGLSPPQADLNGTYLESPSAYFQRGSGKLGELDGDDRSLQERPAFESPLNSTTSSGRVAAPHPHFANSRDRSQSRPFQFGTPSPRAANIKENVPTMPASGGGRVASVRRVNADDDTSTYSVRIDQEPNPPTSTHNLPAPAFDDDDEEDDSMKINISAAWPSEQSNKKATGSNIDSFLNDSGSNDNLLSSAANDSNASVLSNNRGGFLSGGPPPGSMDHKTSPKHPAATSDTSRAVAQRADSNQVYKPSPFSLKRPTFYKPSQDKNGSNHNHPTFNIPDKENTPSSTMSKSDSIVDYKERDGVKTLQSVMLQKIHRFAHFEVNPARVRLHDLVPTISSIIKQYLSRLKTVNRAGAFHPVYHSLRQDSSNPYVFTLMMILEQRDTNTATPNHKQQHKKNPDGIDVLSSCWGQLLTEQLVPAWCKHEPLYTELRPAGSLIFKV
jgi:hypothetical protein